MFEKLRDDALAWRNSGYGGTDFPLIGEILAWQMEEQPMDGESAPAMKFLREPQFLALEAYWYVRLVSKTPHIIALYKHYYGGDKRDFFDALGVSISKTPWGLRKSMQSLKKSKRMRVLLKKRKFRLCMKRRF